MKGIVCICLLAVVATALARPEDHYTNKYDNNIDEFVGNDHLMKLAVVDYLLDISKTCSPEDKDLKSHIQEALETGHEKSKYDPYHKSEDELKPI